MARGFKLLPDAGLISQLPRLFAVQAAACDPVIRAWEQGESEPAAAAPEPSVADGIAVAVPVRGREVLAAVRESGGAAFRVRDESILKAQRRLQRQGLMVEATSAVPVAALSLVQESLGSGARIVVPLTGSGLKTLS
jgi:threonine synthase